MEYEKKELKKYSKSINLHIENNLKKKEILLLIDYENKKSEIDKFILNLRYKRDIFFLFARDDPRRIYTINKKGTLNELLVAEKIRFSEDKRKLWVIFEKYPDTEVLFADISNMEPYEWTCVSNIFYENLKL